MARRKGQLNNGSLTGVPPGHELATEPRGNRHIQEVDTKSAIYTATPFSVSRSGYCARVYAPRLLRSSP